jgi:putative intracellular protease/amidase
LASIRGGRPPAAPARDAELAHPAVQRLIAAVCHGAAGLLAAKRADGRSILHGKRVNGFANDEERAIGLDGVVPFLLQDRMAALAGEFVQGAAFTPFAVRDGQLITDQNPMSSGLVAAHQLQALQESTDAA